MARILAAMSLTTPTIDTDLRYVQRGSGPDVLLVAGLSDPAEAWQAQLDGLADRYRVTAFDNRGSGRSPLPDGPLTVVSMAEDAAALLRALGIERAHVAGFSGGGLIAQELALRHPEVVRTLVLNGTYATVDEHLRRMILSWRRLAAASPDARTFLEDFLVWIYTPAAHADGTVDAIIDEVLGDPHPQSVEAFQRQCDAFLGHDALDRLHAITAPTLVLSGELDLACPPRLGRAIAERIPGAEHVVLRGAAHQPFQEDPQGWNARVDAFWSWTR